MSRRSGRARVFVGVVLVAATALALAWLVLRPDWQQRSIVAVSGDPDRNVLEVTVAHEDCGTGDPRVEANERGEDFVVLSAEYDADGSCDDIGLLSTISVELERNLGNRTIQISTPRPGVECSIAGPSSDRCIEAGATS